jgi:hypothetical protein
MCGCGGLFCLHVACALFKRDEESGRLCNGRLTLLTCSDIVFGFRDWDAVRRHRY